MITTFDEVSCFIAKHIIDEPVCVETGTAYGFPPGEFYFNSTSSIVKNICEPTKGHLYSIDILDRSKNISTLFQLGSTDINRISLLIGDSVEILQSIQVPKIDYLSLDSGNDADLLLNEFLAIQHLLAPKHYILVDDIHQENCMKYKKIVPHLKSLGYEWTEIPTEVGLFVSAKGYPIPERK